MIFEYDDPNVKIINCTFKDNRGTDGGVTLFGDIDPRNTTNGIEFINCIFENNEAQFTGGALVFISSTNTIINCRFKDNKCESEGHSIYIMKPAILNVEDCHFINENIGISGKEIIYQNNYYSTDLEGFILITNSLFDLFCADSSISLCEIEIIDGFLILNNCTFNNNHKSRSKAINIFFNENHNEICHSVFKNCGNGVEYGYAIYCSGKNIDIYHNQFSFDDPSQWNYCIRIQCYLSNTDHRVCDNIFHGNGIKSNWFGTFDYQCDKIGKLIVQNNIFENSKGFFPTFFIKSSKDVSIIFDNNSVKNNYPGDEMYLCGFDFQGTYSSSDVFKITNNKFINNSCNSLYGGGIGIWIANRKMFTFEFENCIFENNSAVFMKNEYSVDEFINGKGGAVQIGYTKITSSINPIFTKCRFCFNQADDEGGALSLHVVGDIIIQDCIFYKNSAGVDVNLYEEKSKKGGAIMINSLGTIKIINCSFDENIACYNSSLSSDSLYEDIIGDKKEGRGGAIIIKAYNSSHMPLNKPISPVNDILIENCSFKSNQAYYGYAIYLEGDDNETIIDIKNNSFIDNFDKKTFHLISSIIEIEMCNITNDEEIIYDNSFTNQNNGTSIYVKKIACFEEILYFSASQFFSQSNFFDSQTFTESNFFDSQPFSESNTFNTPIPPPSKQVDIKISYSKSFSLTYVSRKTVTFSISYFSSNTYEISYDYIKDTYTMVITQTDIHSYFPYIINSLSPLYVEQTIIIELYKRKRISPEQLIGAVCGSVSVFFLILGIIILAMRRRNEIINQYNEFDDISYSSAEEIRNRDDQETHNLSSGDNQENGNFETKDFSEVWI